MAATKKSSVSVEGVLIAITVVVLLIAIVGTLGAVFTPPAAH